MIVSIFKNIYNFLFSKDLKTFLIALSFHVSLYFSTSNKITFLFSIIFLIVLYQHLKKIPLTIFYLFITMLPFAKGKGLEITLLKKEFSPLYSYFNIDYIFTAYFSSFYLLTFYLFYLRKKLFFKSGNIFINNNYKIVIFLFFLFIVTTAFNAIFTIFSTVVLLSSIQLFMLLFIFFMPFVFQKEDFKDLYMIIASSTLFQSVWLILQTLNKGYLNKDIEVFLSISKYSIRSSENNDIARLPGTFFESSILGTFLLTNLSILLFLILRNKIKSKQQKIIVNLTIIFTTIAIILTGSRAVYLILIILLLTMAKLKNIFSVKYFLNIVSKIKKNKIYLTIVAMCFMLIIPFFITRMTSSSQLFSERGSGTYRIELSKKALFLSQQKPILGLGLNLSPYYLATTISQADYVFNPAHPHNILIQLFAETGLVGTLLFVLFLYFIFRPTIKNKFKNLNEFHLAAIIFFICAQFYPIFINQMEIISYLFLYLGLASSYEQNKKK